MEVLILNKRSCKVLISFVMMMLVSISSASVYASDFKEVDAGTDFSKNSMTVEEYNEYIIDTIVKEISQDQDLDTDSMTIVETNEQSYNLEVMQNKEGVVELNETVSTVLVKDKKLLQIISNDKELESSTNIIPLTVTNDGVLVNTFEFAETFAKENMMVSKSRASDQIIVSDFPSDLVDVYVLVRGHYHKQYDDSYSYPTYSPRSLAASVTVRNSNVQLSLFKAYYANHGDIHKYPECLSDYWGSLKSQDQVLNMSISQYFPTSGYQYTDFDALPINERFGMNEFYHRGTLSYEISYAIQNGGSLEPQYHEGGWNIYSK